DILSNALDLRRNCPQLRRRILGEPPENIHVSIVTVDQYLDKILPRIRRARSGDQLVAAFGALSQFLEDLKAFRVLPYDAAADRAFRDISETVRNRHPGDARIAAIGLSRGLTVVTRNRQHFEPTGVPIEDWMLEEIADE